MTALPPLDETGALEVVRKVVSREFQPGVPLPGDDEDLIKTGGIDSMGWVGVLSGIEEASRIRNFGASWPADRPQSVRALVETLREALANGPTPAAAGEGKEKAGSNLAASIMSWGYALGSCRVEAASIENELGLAPGTVSERAGILSVARADNAETEVTLGLQAAERALDMAKIEPEAVDVLVVTSATSLGFPSLAPLLHTRLLLRESCAALDVGGACVGVIYALAAAKGLLSTNRCHTALVVSAEVNGRRLSSPEVPGEFRGLFGDGACAFVLSSHNGLDGPAGSRLGDFVFGCSGAFASSLRITLQATGALEVDFKGEQLASAAVSTLSRVLDSLANLSGIPRSEVGCFAFHEPNPRLIGIFAQRANIPPERIARTTETSGNLGSATCGVNLCTALSRLAANRDDSRRRVIFIAAVGPGLLWGGTYLH